jgi:CHAD domain-containing protein
MTGHATTPVSTGLARLIRRETRRLERQAKQARAGEPRGVHQARVASRRIREMLGVADADPRVSARAVRRDVRRLTSRLGPIRELDVACAVWHETDPSDRWAASASEVLDRRAGVDRRRYVAAMRSALDQVIDGRLGARLGVVADALEQQAAPRVVGAAIGASVRKRAQAVIESLTETGTAYVAGPLHDARIAIKKLRYAAELARDPAGTPVGRQIRQLRRMQDLLGRIHDLQIVQERLQSAAARARVTRTVLDRLEASDEALEIECRRLHGRFVKGLPSLVRAVEHLRDDAAVALLPRRTGRRPAIGPSISKRSRSAGHG